jgi:predicted nucleotidyltransferase
MAQPKNSMQSYFPMLWLPIPIGFLMVAGLQIDCMIQRRDIKKWCEIVAREFRPEQIILFGSYAHGIPTEDSDVDMLVVMPLSRGCRDVQQAAAIRDRVPAPFPMDVIVRSPQQIARRLASGDSFIAGVLRYGQMMYEGKCA